MSVMQGSKRQRGEEVKSVLRTGTGESRRAKVAKRRGETHWMLLKPFGAKTLKGAKPSLTMPGMAWFEGRTPSAERLFSTGSKGRVASTSKPTRGLWGLHPPGLEPVHVRLAEPDF